MSKQMTSAEIRQAFLDYFASKGHQVVASSPLVPGDDPTLLFTNAGMVQFKDVFLGTDKRGYDRAASSQKCMRVSGKHNDLEEVGPSPRHHTFFEMLGNFSFGDYFKRDAMVFAWEFLTEVLGLPGERLAVSVYEKDDESFDLWHEVIGIPMSRIARLGPEDNFWQMAETGPCGPNSEIHWDRHPERGEDDIIPSLEADDGRFLEIWNLVFMQFNRTQPDPEHSGQYDDPLPAPGVDTGLGLERVVAVMQEAPTNYESDLFTDIMDATQEILGHDDAFREEHYVAYRVIADHMRAATFLISDGVTPGNEGRGYIVRMLLRRAMRFAYRMGVERPFLNQVSEAVIHKMGETYPELQQFREAVIRSVSNEEELFLRTLDNSLSALAARINEMETQGQKEMSGEDAFFLFSSLGLPLEITKDELEDRGMTVDMAGFDEAMERHRIESGAGGKLGEIGSADVWRELLADLKADGLLGENGVEYDPYRSLQMDTTIAALVINGERVDRVEYGHEDTVEVVLTTTPFYVESGGQISDTGVITNETWEISIQDTYQPVGGLIIHRGVLTYGESARVGDAAQAMVNNHRRSDIARNHTATHLLHASLRQVLGDHVRQRGSLVAPDRLRFDFSHDEPVTADQQDYISEQINDIILANEPVAIEYKPLDDARAEGAMALFGEKYDDIVRTVTVGDPLVGDPRWSYELCGGTHVSSTAEIGTFIITNEGSSAAGVRRIEAVTGHAAQALIRERAQRLVEAARALGTNQVDEVTERIEALQAELQEARQALATAQRSSAKESLEDLLAQAHQIKGMTVVTGEVDVPNGDLLGEMADWCRDRIDSGIVVLGAAIDGKVRLVAKATKDVVEQGLHAGKTVGAVAKLVDGGGGGRPDFATAGGKTIEKLPEALAAVPSIVEAALEGNT